jgi:hypothetical protein
LGFCPLNLLFHLLVAQVTSLHIRWATIHMLRNKTQKIENQPCVSFRLISRDIVVSSISIWARRCSARD